MDALKTILNRIKVKTPGLMAIANNNDLKKECDEMGIVYDPVAAAAAKNDIKMAYVSFSRCSGCKKTAAEAAAASCCINRISFHENNGYQLGMANCPRATAYRQQQRMARILDGSGLGDRFKNRTFDSFVIDSDPARIAYERCYDFATNSDPGRRGLILSGGVGAGKTHLAAAICTETISRGKTALFIPIPMFFAKLKRGFADPKEGAEGTEIMKNIGTADVVVLDDLGAEKRSEWSAEQIYLIINERYENGKPIVITTNLTTRDLMLHLGQRTASRLYEMTTTLIFNGRDHRKEEVAK